MEMRDKVRQRVKEIEAEIEVYLPEEKGHQVTIFRAMNDAMRAGGKRLRPMLMEETYRLFGGDGEEIKPFMAAVEMIHTSSLIHDDLPCMDNDTLRRGKPTTWVTFGEDMAVLAGDALLIYAVETAQKAFAMTEHMDRVAKAIGILASKTGIYGMIGGQVLDVELTDQPMTREQLEFIHENKTGALLELSMMVGAVLGGATEDELKLVEKIASAVGLAFQIQDDILDVTSTEAQLGKPVKSDEKNHKTTYVTLVGLEQAKKDVAAWSEQAITWLAALDGTNEFLEALIRMLVTREK